MTFVWKLMDINKTASEASRFRSGLRIDSVL